MRRSAPVISECFRNATLHRAAPLSQVREQIERRALLTSHSQTPTGENYSSFYRDTDDTKLQFKNIHDRLVQKEIENTQNYSVEAELHHRQRRLTILFSWLGAKERYANKYIQLWTDRGHDVLYVTSSVKDLLMPKTGAEVTAQRILDHISKLDNWRVLVHGLSVGGFITQHVLKVNDSNITSKISHQIYDSFTNVEGLADGVENAVNPRFRNIARKVGDLYLKYADLSSFNESRNYILNGKAHSPVFFMHSLADQVARYPVTEPLVRALQAKCPVATFLLPAGVGVPHVALLRHMGPPAYMHLVETFLENHRDQVD